MVVAGDGKVLVPCGWYSLNRVGLSACVDVVHGHVLIGIAIIK